MRQEQVIFNSLDEARESPLLQEEGTRRRIFKVWHRTRTWYIVSLSPREALGLVAGEQGYQVELTDPKHPTIARKKQLKEMLAGMDADTREAVRQALDLAMGNVKLGLD